MQDGGLSRKAFGAACLVALLLAGLAGCTARAPYELAKGHEGAPGVERVLLGPLNLEVALPPEVADVSDPVSRELVAYLGEQDLQISHLGLMDGRRAWARAGSEAKEHDAPERAPEILARNLAEGLDFDALILPSVVLHDVRVFDNSGTWCGVRRKLKMVNIPSRGLGGSADTFTKGVAAGGIRGTVTVASLHVTVLAPDGAQVFDGWGGFDFIEVIDLNYASGFGTMWGFRPKSPTLSDEVVVEGVRIAFAPYLPRRAAP